MTELVVLGTADRSAWAAALARAGRHDFYHEAWYHELAEERGEGRAALIVASHHGATMALPLLFRRIDAPPGIGLDGLEDATSVYGYPGPVGAHAAHDPGRIAELGNAMGSYLRDRGTVSLFSRLHPLFEHGIPEPAQVFEAGVTASIDLGRPITQQWSDTRSGHRNGINRLRRAGFTCERRPPAELDTFVSLYEGTMQRLDAKPHYLFTRAHYEALLDPERGGMALFVVADPSGVPAAVGLFSLRCGIAQYHLSGATLEHRKHAPTLLLVDEARRWAMEQGATTLHLGGGLGGLRDSLFDFKSGFGSGRHVFRAWRWVLRPGPYRELAALRRGQIATDCEPGDDISTFFPSYRAP